jgi:glycosyltransferase involved in cell wall biosynthesis
MKKIKVTHVVTAYQSVTTILESKLRVLGKFDDLDVTVISSPPDTDETRDPVVRHIPVNMARTIRPLMDAKSIWQLYKIIKRENFDVVHSHTAKAGFITSFAARLAKVPVVCHTSHGLPFFEGQNKFSYWSCYILEKIACKFRHFLFTQNKKDLDACIKLMGDKKKVFYEGNGVDVEFIKKSAERQLEIAKNAFPNKQGLKIVLSSRLEPVKRIEDFIAVIEKAKEKGVDFSCVIAGDGLLKESLRNQINKYNIKNSINLIGFCRYSHSLIALSDMVVLCSEKEGIPRSLMEAMALGKPVVATDVVGTQELVVNNETGFLVPLGDTDAMAEKIKYLAENPDIRKEMGRRGLERVKAEFNDIKIAKFLHDFYVSKMAELLSIAVDSKA